jgi:hypothetical protein
MNFLPVFLRSFNKFTIFKICLKFFFSLIGQWLACFQTRTVWNIAVAVKSKKAATKNLAQRRLFEGDFHWQDWFLIHGRFIGGFWHSKLESGEWRRLLTG